jgi:UPF0755 protein
MNTDKRSGLAMKLLMLLFVAAIFFSAILYTNQILEHAENNFGQASDNLNSWQQLRLKFELGLNGDALLQVGPEKNTIFFEIEIGESLNNILANLLNAGLIQESDLLRSYLIYSGLDRNIQAGRFELNGKMKDIDIAQALLDATPGQIKIVIFPGWRLEEIAASLGSAGFSFSEDSFLDNAFAYSDDFQFLSDLPSGHDLEGYFIAGDYQIDRELDAAALVHFLLQRSNLTLSEDLVESYETLGLTLHEALTLASIIEREALLEQEMAMIASVFLNRLEIGMRLEADPTAQYAAGFDEESQSWWVHPILSQHLELQSPYNTYTSDGLPPGPIASPSLAALQALANPEESPFFFFQADCDASGQHVFAITFEEHLKNNCP